MRSTWLVIVLAACGGKAPPPAPAVVAPSAPPPARDAAPPIDEDRFVGEDGKPMQHCKLRGSTYEIAYDPVQGFEAHGTIELDAQRRITRTDMHATIGDQVVDDLFDAATGTLDVPDKTAGGPRRRVVVEPPVDLEIGDAPCMAEPLCALAGDAALRDLTWDHETPLVMVHAYAREDLAGGLHRIAYDFFGKTEELACDGPRLVAGTSFGAWFVRPGHEAALAALKAAPRIAAREFPDELEAARPWRAKETWFTDNVVVTRDAKLHTELLRAFDRKTGKLLATRTYASAVQCTPVGRDDLACTTGAAWVKVDARTLADRGPGAEPAKDPAAAPPGSAPSIADADLAGGGLTICGPWGTIVMTKSHVALVTRANAVKWKAEVDGEIAAGHMYGNEIVVGTSGAARVAALDFIRGKVHWTVPAP